MTGFDDLTPLLTDTQAILDLLDNDLKDTKNRLHADDCLETIYKQIKNNLKNEYGLKFALKINNTELFYWYSSSKEKILEIYRKIFRLLNNYENIKLLCDDYEKMLKEKKHFLKDEDNSYIPKLEDLRKIQEKFKKEEIKTKITTKLRQYNFIESDKIFISQTLINHQEYERLKKKYLKEYKFKIIKEKRDKIIIELESLLKKEDFVGSDSTFNNQTNISQHEYEHLKAKYIQMYFKKTFEYKGKDFELDSEQAESVGALGKRILVSARAGSGKTRVLIAKALFLIEKENVDPESILIMAFNTKVPDEITKKIHNEISFKPNVNKYKDLNIAQTFHKFSLDITKDKNVLIEEKKKFIQEIIECVKRDNPEFKNKVYEHFRNESCQTSQGLFKAGEEKKYYSYLRNIRHTTLLGESVKSIGEKWIADFLFEHNIDYWYEHEFYTNKFRGIREYEQSLGKFKRESTKPDFFLYKHNIILEHWGIDENEKNQKEKDKFSNIMEEDWDSYKSLMESKRKFWGEWRKNIPISSDEYKNKIIKINNLIETSVVNLGNPYNRKQFENILIKKLEEKEIQIQIIEKEVLIKKVWDRAFKRFSKQIESFINRYQQLYFDNHDEFIKKVKTYKSNHRVNAFLELGNEILYKYEEQLKIKTKIATIDTTFSKYNVDFNQVIYKAIQNIKNGVSDEKIKNLKWILIDEYQDFSKLFLELIKAIISRNPDVKLFCVGDNWQAINRFMGSDTKYLDYYEKYLGEYNSQKILTNYRSIAEIVTKSNNFILNNGFNDYLSISANHKKGEITILDINEISSSRILSLNEHKGFSKVLEKYAKCCCEIIKKNKGKEILILHRNNNIKIMPLDTFVSKIKQFLTNENIIDENCKNKISFSTIHKAKGMEADIVILLEIVEGLIPMNHPDNELFEIFNEDIKTNMEDQKRLFYVAITRAREKLYILTEKGKESEYIKDLG